MIAQLKAINLKAVKRTEGGKSYTGVEVTYQGQPYKGQEKPPTTRFLFSNNPVAQALSNFQSGDWVEISFDNDKWKTPNDIKKAADPNGAPAPKASASGGGSWGKQDESTTLRIARAVAIKEATVLAMAMATAGAFAKTKTSNKEFMAQQVLEIAKIYEPYLLGTDPSDALEMPEIGGDDFDQEGFED